MNNINLQHDQIISMIEKSVHEVLSGHSKTNGNIELEQAINNSKELLEKFRIKLHDDILELRELAEWDTFTIAFYGETNAGKSTLIEALRILLEDPSKIATQQKFKHLYEDLKVDPIAIEKLEKSITQLELKISEIKNENNIIYEKSKIEEKEKSSQLETLKTTIKIKRKNLNSWQKIVFFFKKLEEEKALPQLEMQLIQMKARNNLQREAIEKEPIKIIEELNIRRNERAQVEKTLEQLIPLQDGNIIGNGRSDYTLESHTYHFISGSQNFQLIDVPGIEGDEKQVMSSIDISVKKAHAVFYVTRTATPPGSGSEGQEGTIDKIKRQLGKQTEVWTIYNKSATNPQILQGKTLINQNDFIGLVDMDKSLTNTLGEDTYKGHMCVSGMPAFLASASCFLPNNTHSKSREKFLTTMSASEILKRSGMDALLHFIRTEICQNFLQKISAANVKKITTCLQEGVDHLRQALENFDNAAKKLNAQHQSASSQIDALVSSTAQRLKSECHDHLTSKKTAMRASIYDFIESDQSNDDFKEQLTEDIEELKTSVGEDMEARFINVFENFKNETGEIIKKNQKNVDEILHYTINAPFSSLELSFNTNFKMENGINVIGLISTLGGAAALVWTSFLASNPLGWTTAAVLGAVGLVFSFYKAVRSFFSSDYKKKQQYKSADENLDKVFEKLTEMLENNLESAITKINEALIETKNQMRLPYEQSINTKEALTEIAAKMTCLRDDLISEQTSATKKVS